jgi:uncharacterized membrane protein
LLTVTLFGKEECHLCDQAKSDLQALQDQYPHHLAVINIDGNEDLEAAYGVDIPVVEVGPYTLRAPFSRPELAMTLGAAQDRKQHLESIDSDAYQARVERGQKISRADRFAWWFADQYMLVFNLLILIYVGLPFLAPVLQRAGATLPASAIYRVYGGLCHQLTYRSWFIYGEQPVYPRQAASVDEFKTFEELTTTEPEFASLSLDDENAVVWAARGFRGNDSAGYKIALCQRDVAIYGIMLLFGIAFALTGRRLKPLPFIAWIIIGIVPIALDGGTQLVYSYFSALDGEFWQSLAQIFPPRESTPFLRTLTGGLFGLTTAWFGYPLVEEAMADTRLLLTKKFAHVTKSENGD